MVANGSGDSVTPVVLQTETAEPDVPVGNDPTAIAITPDASQAFVANTGDNTVTPIETQTLVPQVPIRVRSAPAGVAITPNRKTAWVTDSLSGQLTPITVATDKPGKPVAVGPNSARHRQLPLGVRRRDQHHHPATHRQAHIRGCRLLHGDTHPHRHRGHIDQADLHRPASASRRRPLRTERPDRRHQVIGESLGELAGRA